MKNDKITKHIHELCLQSGMQSNEFEEKICDAINSDVNSGVEIPVHSTMNRWYNGETVPNTKMFPYVAKALDVSEEEIRLGEKPQTDYLKNELEKVNEVLNMNEEEKQVLSRILFMSKYYLRLFAVFILSFGLFFLNSTLWKSGLVYLVIIGIVVFTYKYDKRKFSDYYKNEKEKSRKQKIKDDWEFIRFLLKKELVSRLCLNIVILVIVIIFLPVLETHFYRGKFFITSSIYFFIGFLLLCRSVENK